MALRGYKLLDNAGASQTSEKLPCELLGEVLVFIVRLSAGSVTIKGQYWDSGEEIVLGEFSQNGELRVENKPPFQAIWAETDASASGVYVYVVE